MPIYSSNCCGCMQQLLILAAVVAACICSDWSTRREGVQNNARWIFPNQLKYSLGLFCSKSHILSRCSRMVMTVQKINRMKIMKIAQDNVIIFCNVFISRTRSIGAGSHQMGISYSLEIFFGVVLLQIPSANQYDII